MAGRRPPPQPWPALAGAVVVLALFAAAVAVLALGGRVDLAAGFAGGVSQVLLRSGLALAAVGLLALASGRRRRHLDATAGEGAGWLAGALLVLAAAGHDRSWLALPLLAAAGALTAHWAGRLEWRGRPGAVAAVVLLAVGLSAVAWETAYRVRLRHELATSYLPRLAPPTGDELRAFQESLRAHFDDLALDHVPSPTNSAVDPQDLAFTLWRASPLAALDGLSALVIELPDGRSSRFSFGLSVTDGLDIDWDVARWQVPQVPAWIGAMTEGGGTVRRDGEAIGRLHYWLVPRPGFRLGVSEIDELGPALVRSRAGRQAVDGLPPGVLYGLYDLDGRAVESPWQEAPPLPAPPAVRDAGVVATPAGRARYWLRQAEDGAEVLYLPILGARRALERAGTHAFAAAVVLAIVAAVALVLALPGARFRDVLTRTVRSYSRRLILVFTLLLILPLVALNGVVLRELEARMRGEQVAAGRGALDAARLFLVDLLENLEPGFGIDTAIDREVLEWISAVVQHHVNLYWGSTVYTSSRQELFTAGLLPRRIPGDVYARLVLLGYGLGTRTQQAGDLTYGEIYAPLTLPGAASGGEGLFLSVPLLEQEEEVLRELAALRRRAILVSTALFLLLVALGSRLARRFTEPLEELVAGTRRIAAGADRLGTAPPRELELAALADAIDTMARRIAQARGRVLREKEVVERIVANITSAVVSLDVERRVLLANRVAEELLGATPGEPLAAAVARRPALAPVGRFLDGVRGEPRQETVELTGEEGTHREWNLTWVPIPGSEEPAALLVIDDATEVLRGQRLAAWAEMARLIAHEIKNPLTPIQLSTEHLRRVHEAGDPRFGEVFERCTRNILEQVAELREIASEFSTYSRIPKADLRWGNLVATVGDLVAAYRDAAGRGVEIVLVSREDEVPVRLDERLLGRALRNLVENALRASGGTGRVEVAVGRGDGEATVAVRDEGPGVRPEVLPRIFDPYFSTHDTGTGLGLAIARRVVEEHGGRIEAHNRATGGLEVRITLPLAEAPTAEEGEDAEVPRS